MLEIMKVIAENKKALFSYELLEKFTAGIVLTGGGAKLPKIKELAKKELKLPCKIGYPRGIAGLEEDPSLALVAGLILSSLDSAEEAQTLELVDEVITEEDLIEIANKKISDLIDKPTPAFASIKSLLRKPVLDKMLQKEKESIEEFVDIWYSDKTWENLKNVKIY